MSEQIRGPEGQGIELSKIVRDTRSTKQKFKDMIATPEGFMVTMGVCLGLFILAPAFGEVWGILSAAVILMVKRDLRLPFRLPKSSGLLDYGQPNPGTGKPEMAEGIHFFGNEKKTKKELWFNNSDMRTHCLIFGTTGAGKTETLLSLAYNALVQGSGLIYVDGKGENVLFTKVFAMARTMGREDDVLCINYMTGSRDVFGPQVKKSSNTLNPFSSGSAGGLTELLVSLMDGAGGGNGDMWKGRAISLISALMMALTYMRDQKEILLDVEVIREHLILETLINLYKKNKHFPPHIRAALRAYLVSLPGFQENSDKQPEEVYTQHGYLQMQFTKILGSLSDSYGYIFKTNLGEVDFKDVVINRRILVVLLPALEKSTEELMNLGKIIVACLKQMMAQALGATIEGSYQEVVETKPTNAPMPFMAILDEFGYYAVPGSAVMPAQARSLGFSMIFAGQDLPAFERASKEEAASIIANCNIKICMKLEDPKSTYELFESSASDMMVVVDGRWDKQGTSNKLSQSGGGSVETKKRINILDLKDQDSGDAHIVFKSVLVRAKMFYAAPPKPPHIKVNSFLRVEPPEDDVVKQMDSGLQGLIRSFVNEEKLKDLQDNFEVDEDYVPEMMKLLERHSALRFSEAAFATIASIGNRLFDESNKTLEEIDEDDGEFADVKEVDMFSKGYSEKIINDRYGHLNRDDEDDDEFSDSEFDDDDDDEIFRDEAMMKERFLQTERMMGKSEEQTREESERMVKDMRAASQYPHERPDEKDPDEIIDIIAELDDLLDEK